MNKKKSVHVAKKYINSHLEVETVRSMSKIINHIIILKMWNVSKCYILDIKYQGRMSQKQIICEYE